MKANIFALMACVLLVSCSLLAPVKTPPKNTYELSATPGVLSIKQVRHINLLVAAPTISAAYNTQKIAYTTKPYLLGFYSHNQWAETPAEMLHPLLVQTLQPYFHAVVTPPFTGHYDYLLTTQIDKLQLNMLKPQASAQLQIRIQLTQLTNNQIIATKTIMIDEPMIKATPYDGVLAANLATEHALEQIARFCVRYVQE